MPDNPVYRTPAVSGNSDYVNRLALRLKRLRFTDNQRTYMVDVIGLVHELRSYDRGSLTLTAADADEVLRRVPRSGRTAMSIRRKVASELRAAELRAEVGR